MSPFEIALLLFNVTVFFWVTIWRPAQAAKRREEYLANLQEERCPTPPASSSS